MLRILRSFAIPSPLQIITFSLSFVLQSAPHAGPASIDAAELSPYSIIGPWTISAGFPQGGSTWGSPSLSLRKEIVSGEFVTAGLNLSSDKSNKSDSFGLFAKVNHMLSSGWGKSFPYFFLQSGYLSQQTSENAKRTTSALFALGMGVEVTLLREISTSVETGVGGVMWPASQLNYTAGTTQLSVHYHFQL